MSQFELLKIAEVLFVEIEGEKKDKEDKKEGEEAKEEEEEKKKEEAAAAAPAEEEEKKSVTVIARCKDERNSNKLVEELNSKGFHDAKVEAKLLQGDEEKAFWDKALAAMNAAENLYRGHKGRGGKRPNKRGRH